MQKGAMSLVGNVLVAVSLAAAAGCGPPSCPRGYDQRGDTCYRHKDAGPAEAGMENGDPELLDGGVVGEAGTEQTGSSAEAGPTLSRPVIEGATSMAPGRERWSWSVPPDTDHFEVLVDRVAPQKNSDPREPSFAGPLELGDHTLQVRACSAAGGCSDWASHTTRVEAFGQDLPRGLRDAARGFGATALGHRVAVGCNDCADGPDSEVYNLEQAAASSERAIARGADLVELNIASIGGAIYASPTDTGSAGARPLLADLLRRDRVISADALLVLEVVEGSPAMAGVESPEDFAEGLFAVIDAASGVARNGRPLLLRASYENRSYLKALSAAAERHTVTGPYVRFVLSDPGREPATFYGSANDGLVPDLDFLDAVSVDFGLSNLPFRLERIRAAGSAVIVENVPGPGHGEIVLGALREEADAFITNYRVDQARNIVRRTDTGAFFDARDIAADGRVLTVHGVRGGASSTWELELGHSFKDHWTSAIVLNTPIALESSEAGLFGPYLSFREAISELPLANTALALERSSGFLFSFVGTLPSFEPGRVSVMFGGWPASGAGGISSSGLWSTGLQIQSGELLAALLTPEPGQEELKSRAEIRVPAKAGPGCTSRNQPFIAPLKEAETRWIVLSYDGSDLILFIDGKCAASAGVYGVTDQDDVASATVLGSGIFGGYYLGHVQQFGVLRWSTIDGDSEN